MFTRVLPECMSPWPNSPEKDTSLVGLGPVLMASFFFIYYYYLLAALGLHCCSWASLFVAIRGYALVTVL